MTFPLITTASGQKMGKTHSGAIWLDPELTSPYEFYQYWINTDDADVKRFLALFTFLPMEEVREIRRTGGSGPAESQGAARVRGHIDHPRRGRGAQGAGGVP